MRLLLPCMRLRLSRLEDAAGLAVVPLALPTVLRLAAEAEGASVKSTAEHMVRSVNRGGDLLRLMPRFPAGSCSLHDVHAHVNRAPSHI